VRLRVLRVAASEGGSATPGKPSPELIIDTEAVSCTPKASQCIILWWMPKIRDRFICQVVLVGWRWGHWVITLYGVTKVEMVLDTHPFANWKFCYKKRFEVYPSSSSSKKGDLICFKIVHLLSFFNGTLLFHKIWLLDRNTTCLNERRMMPRTQPFSWIPPTESTVSTSGSS
jgi:hypothetical protein